jgi:radical SAM superfamily enzyme YgiQ (UPF0313 family)
MKILLVHPQNYLQQCATGIYGRSMRYAPLTMPTLKALVPPELGAEVEIVDEMTARVDFGHTPDLVGLTAITGTAAHAYEIADRFRAQGATVVMGGVHPTLLPDEARQHADAVIKGYAERTWPQALRDFAAGKLASVYEDRQPFSASLIVRPDRSSISARDYIGWATVETSRGCPNACDFCISHRFHRDYICRPVGDVIEEVRALRSKVIFFLDPNLIGDHAHAKDLFRELAKLRRWWLGCASLDVVEDPELLDLIAQSGCKGLLMGFESTDPQALAAANKVRNQGKEYREVLRVLHEHGILVQGCFVFGFDSDERSVFTQTADYIIEAGFDLPQVSIFTPFPGTPAFARLAEQGRILTRDWSRYNGQTAVFRPAHMTAGELEEGADYVRRRCYSLGALARRLVCRPLGLKPLVALSYLSFRRYQRAIDRVSRSHGASH